MRHRYAGESIDCTTYDCRSRFFVSMEYLDPIFADTEIKGGLMLDLVLDHA
jgi:hypothetical protein